MTKKDVIPEFEEWLKVNKRKKEKTVYTHTKNAKRILKVSRDFPPAYKDLQRFLKKYDTGNEYTYENLVKSIRVFTRFLGIGELGKEFDFPRIPYQVKKIPSDEQVRAFYHALPNEEDRAFYLVLATSGLRYGEAIDLKVEDVDAGTGMLNSKSRSIEKGTYITFVNEEALRDLLKVMPESGKIFDQYKSKTYYRWKKARKETGADIKPKDLRSWFADKMARLGVPDRYIDAFCGRVPQSVLARHYTDFSPERLKEVYEEAEIKVLN